MNEKENTVASVTVLTPLGNLISPRLVSYGAMILAVGLLAWGGRAWGAEGSGATVSGMDATRPRAIVGAIRWDAWFGDTGLDTTEMVDKKMTGEKITPGMAVERSLGPNHWHYRLPFYAKVISENKVEVRANSQKVMDQEIAYASQAGLDYWAFLTYDTKGPLMIGLNLYLSSSDKAKVKFCFILHHIAEYPEEIERIVGYMKDPQYVRVLDGRPLVYAFQCKATKELYDGLLKAVAEAGLKRPYLVNMGSNAKEVTFDAVSSYSARDGSRFFDSKKKEGLKVVPPVSAGWDDRPRYENPVPWGWWKKKPVTGGRLISPEKAASDIANGVRDALVWNQKNPEAGEANAVIIYAWNEFDEGGWICPTISEGTSRLDAISKVLKEAEQDSLPGKTKMKTKPNILKDKNHE